MNAIGSIATRLLLNLQLVDLRGQLLKDLVCSLVVFELCSNEIRKVAKWLRCIEDLENISRFPRD